MLSAGIRFEEHNPNNGLLYSSNFSQRFIEFRRDWLMIRAGNFYERFGRGLVFHAFEIQSQNLDRIEQNFILDKNIDGININITTEKFELKGIWGKPLMLFSNERGKSMGGAEIQVHPYSPLMLGWSFLRNNMGEPAGGTFSADIHTAEFGIITSEFDVYGEISRRKSTRTLLEPDGTAFYISTTYSGWRFGASTEFKRYKNFGTIFNNPPALVKTHSFTLLNRHTHTLSADDETGFQFEGYFTPNESSTITIHASIADNIARDKRRAFREYFIESRNEWNESWITRLLFDYSKDRPVGDLNRWTFAGDVDYLVDNRNSLLGDVQIQHIENENSGKYWNYLGLLSVSRSPWLSVTIQSEWTTKMSSFKSNWVSGVVTIKTGQRSDFLLSIGSRPAGLVCSGGICTFTPEFEGIELRWDFRVF